MITIRSAVIVAVALAELVAAAPVNADPAPGGDPDTNFANELHTYGIYGPRDYDAWIGKLGCRRLHTTVDRDAVEAATFIGNNLGRRYSTAQTWQFLESALTHYCPDKRVVLDQLAANQTQAPKNRAGEQP